MTEYQPKENQNTLRHKIEISGIGIFTGEQTSVKIHPASANFGIVFCRSDLSGSPRIPAQLEFVEPSPRCTKLRFEDACIFMVEHLLSALYSCGVDNAFIEVCGSEIPALDGSSKGFVDAIEKAGLQELDALRNFISIQQPIYWSKGDVHLVALPSEEFQLSYTLHYPQSPLIKSQYYSFCVGSESYKTDIAPCRTFSLYDEILPFIQKGIIKGGGLENALIVQGDKVLNPEGARFENEMVRHKILDLIGDLSLIGARIKAHVIAICSGHSSNVAFAKVLSDSLQPGSV